MKKMFLKLNKNVKLALLIVILVCVWFISGIFTKEDGLEKRKITKEAKVFVKEINPIDYENDVNKITQLQADAMSNQILEKPDDWFWQHRRWKDIYLGIYK